VVLRKLTNVTFNRLKALFKTKEGNIDLVKEKGGPG
jgi:hypothetical protein